MCNAQSGTLRGRLIAQLRFRSSQKLILAPVMTMLNSGLPSYVPLGQTSLA